MNETPPEYDEQEPVRPVAPQTPPLAPIQIGSGYEDDDLSDNEVNTSNEGESVTQANTADAPTPSWRVDSEESLDESYTGTKIVPVGRIGGQPADNEIGAGTSDMRLKETELGAALRRAVTEAGDTSEPDRLKMNLFMDETGPIEGTYTVNGETDLPPATSATRDTPDELASGNRPAAAIEAPSNIGAASEAAGSELEVTVAEDRITVALGGLSARIYLHDQTHIHPGAVSATASVNADVPYPPDFNETIFGTPGFDEVILGSDVDPQKVQVHHLANIGDSTLFGMRAPAHGYYQGVEGGAEDGRSTLARIAARILRYTDDPGQAAQMMNERPFGIVEEDL